MYSDRTGISKLLSGFQKSSFFTCVHELRLQKLVTEIFYYFLTCNRSNC